MRRLEYLAAIAGMLVIYVALCQVLTSPEFTARYKARQETQQVELREWNDTLRTWGMWGGGGLAAVGTVSVVAWAVVEWQKQRTQRAATSEDQATERHLITAKRDIALAWIAKFGSKGDYPGDLNGVDGVFCPSDGEFVPLDVCSAELAQLPAPTRRFRVVGVREEL